MLAPACAVSLRASLYVNGQEEVSLATACGFCGDRVTCSTQVLMRNKRTHALVTLMLSDCPSQPAKLRWKTLAKKSASSPCTNHPVRCPLCTKAIWSYCMAQHYADEHATARHPYLMQVADAEQEAVLNWVPHKAKKKKPGNHLPGMMQRPPLLLATLRHRRQACLPCLPLSLSLLRPPCQVSPRQRPLGLSDLVLLKASGSATRRGGMKPNGSFNRSAPAETPPPPPQRGSFSRTSKQKSIHFSF